MVPHGEVDDLIPSSEASRAVGRRAEEVANWYFRLNGFFLIPGFIVHPDAKSPSPRTEADLLGIRLKKSTEGVWSLPPRNTYNPSRERKPMHDHEILIDAGKSVTGDARNLVCLVEVKSGTCSINGPWSNKPNYPLKGNSNMERALARVGFAENKAEVGNAALAMYERLRYEGNAFIVQYFAVGKRKSPELEFTYPMLVQITFDDIAEFFHERFSQFPEKIPERSDISLWQGFGDTFRNWFDSNSGLDRVPKVVACKNAVAQYIETGNCF